MSQQEPTTIGLSRSGQAKLNRMKEEKFFKEALDGYRFAIGLALAQGVLPGEIEDKTTIYNVGTVDDQEKSIQKAIQAILGEQLNGLPVYRMAERLAEWGVHELFAMAESGRIDFARLIEEATGKVAKDGDV